QSGLSAERLALLELLLAEEGKIPDSGIVPVERNGLPLEASFGQERLWFFEQLEPGSTLFNESGVLRVEGPLDVRVFELAWEEIFRRQESFRTSFVSQDG